jgi:hypothetical protein
MKIYSFSIELEAAVAELFGDTRVEYVAELARIKRSVLGTLELPLTLGCD